VSPGVATKVVGASCGLTAFAVCVAAGLLADNPVNTILTRALVGLVAGQIAGSIVGAIGERTIAEALDRYRKTHPFPDAGARSSTSAAPAETSVEKPLAA